VELVERESHLQSTELQPLELVVEVELLTLAQTLLEVTVGVELVLMPTTLQLVVQMELLTQVAVAVEVCLHQAQLEDLLEVREL
jgi:hypothetical protein